MRASRTSKLGQLPRRTRHEASDPCTGAGRGIQPGLFDDQLRRSGPRYGTQRAQSLIPGGLCRKCWGVLGAALLLAASSWYLVAQPARASCGGPTPMRQAIDSSRATFVGTVAGLENRRRWATVDVLETWKGPQFPGEVVVKAGPKDPPGPTMVASSIDRTYILGQTYLFVVYGGKGAVFRDSNCSRTARFDERLARFRPTSAEVDPTPSSSVADSDPNFAEEGRPVVLLAAVIVAVGAIAAAVLLLRIRRP